jgi:hypothetical protein
METQRRLLGYAKLGRAHPRAHCPVALSPKVPFVQNWVQLPAVASAKYPTVQLLRQVLVTGDLK